MVTGAPPVLVAFGDYDAVRLRQFASVHGGALRLPASKDFHMTSRFPRPWRIAEFPNGFAVYDDRAREQHAYPLRRVLGALPVEEMAELAERGGSTISVGAMSGISA